MLQFFTNWVFRVEYLSYQNFYHLLLVTRFGIKFIELWQYNSNSDYVWVNRLKELGATDREVYDRIKFTGVLIRKEKNSLVPEDTKLSNQQSFESTIK